MTASTSTYELKPDFNQVKKGGKNSLYQMN